MIKKAIAIPILLFAFIAAYSQTDSSDAKNSFRTGLQFISNQNFAGRTDSLNLPVLIPSVKWQSASGFYINAKGYLNLSQKSGFDGVSIEPGFNFGKKLNGSVSLIKYFIKDSSNLVIAPLKTALEFYLSYDNDVISPSFGSEYAFTDEGNDFIIYAGLSKLIHITKENSDPAITFDPSFTVSAGTQAFYYSFLKNHSIRKNRGSSSTTKKQSQQFNVLNTDIEAPLSLAKGKFEAVLTPALETPLNIVSSTSTQTSKSFFYVSAEVALNF